MRSLLLVLPALLFLAPEARAQTDAVPWRDPLPAREVERPLALPRGWTALDIGYDEHIGRGQWTSDGHVQRFHRFRWAVYTERVRLARGLSRRVEAWWEVPVVEGRLVDDRFPGGRTLLQGGPGDQRVGARIQLLHQEAPSASMALDTWFEVPFARARPGTWVGGSLAPQHLIFGTGTLDWFAGGAFRRAFGPIGVTGTLGWLHRFAGNVPYRFEGEPNLSAIRIAPGDQLRARVEVLLQAGPFVLATTPSLRYRMVTRVGAPAGLFAGNGGLQQVRGSAGSEVDLRFDLRVQLSRGLAVGVYYTRPLRGEDLDFFPIEALEPTFGPDLGACVQARL